MRNWLAVLAILVSLAAACGDDDAKRTGSNIDPTPTPQEENSGDDDDGHPHDPRPTPTPEPLPTPTPGPYLAILSPEDYEKVPNPVTFTFDADPAIRTVTFECEGYSLQSEPIPAEQGTHTYEFNGTNYPREVVLTGYNSEGEAVSHDTSHVTAVEQLCPMADEEGFNHYTIAALNDWAAYPKNGLYEYCWSSTCGEIWGQVYDGYYGGEFLFDGGGDCYCSGHTLEIFLRAFRLYLEDYGLEDSTIFTSDENELPIDAVDVGTFYQIWQGWEGVADYASAADALEYYGVGVQFYEEEWDQVLPGDFVNIWRTNGSGHSVIFVRWLVEDDAIVGLRYYSCNTWGESCPDSDDPDNTWDNSGPSFSEEYFEEAGGEVIRELLFIGRPFLPTL